jgi:hypothetical protein
VFSKDFSIDKNYKQNHKQKFAYEIVCIHFVEKKTLKREINILIVQEILRPYLVRGTIENSWGDDSDKSGPKTAYFSVVVWSA